VQPEGIAVRVPISFIIPTLNEERNIRLALDSIIGWADQVLVLDSFSTDQTCEIARARNVEVVQHRFENFSAQKNWALDNLPLRNDWVFFLDADERVTRELRTELAELLTDGSPPRDGYYVGMKHLFMGSFVKHGGWYPNLRLLLFRHRLGRYEQRIVHEHLVLRGPTGRLDNLLVHDDQKGLHRYFDRHNHYSTMEALEALAVVTERDVGQRISANLAGTVPERRRAVKHFAYRYLPCRPLLKFIWSYLLKRGFLDGRIGFRYCVLQSIYEYQISLKLLELRSDPHSANSAYGWAALNLSKPKGGKGVDSRAVGANR
jgi:glycosyltransferase involved in cell wall biosynthesis